MRFKGVRAQCCSFSSELKRIFAMTSRVRMVKPEERWRSKLKSNCGGLGFCALGAVENMCLTLLQREDREMRKEHCTKQREI